MGGDTSGGNETPAQGTNGPLTVSPANGTEKGLVISVDVSKVPNGVREISVNIEGGGEVRFGRRDDDSFSQEDRATLQSLVFPFVDAGKDYTVTIYNAHPVKVRAASGLGEGRPQNLDRAQFSYDNSGHIAVFNLPKPDMAEVGTYNVWQLSFVKKEGDLNEGDIWDNATWLGCVYQDIDFNSANTITVDFDTSEPKWQGNRFPQSGERFFMWLSLRRKYKGIEFETALRSSEVYGY
jgi:hypothetical protein